MASKVVDNASYKALCAEIAANTPGNLYVFTGEERYLLEHSVRQLRAVLLEAGTDDFNYRRYEGKGLEVADIAQAVDAVPLFAPRTLVEIYDYAFDEHSEEEKKQLLEVLMQLPDYVCLVFIFDTVEFKLDGRSKLNQELKKLLKVVRFELQEQSELVKWIRKRLRAAGKAISPADAEYLSFLTGGSMTALVPEIEKVAACSASQTVTREEIDAVVTPVPETEAYKLSDALIRGNTAGAAQIMSELFQMRVAPHKIMFWVARDLRWLTAARLCADNGKGTDELVRLCGIRYRFQADNMMRAARRRSMDWCRQALLSCCETAYRLNSSGIDGETLLKGLLISLSV